MTLRTPLITAADLHTAMSSGACPLLFDVGFDLTDPAAGRRRFADSHLPGARHLHLDDDLSAPKTGHNGRHPLPDRADFAVVAGRHGISPDRPIVVYDHQGGMYAARAWWMLRWLGHADVTVLDGGYAAWVAAGGAVESGDSAPPDDAGAYPITGHAGQRTVDADDLQRRLGSVALLDARAAERFRGEVEPLDSQAGHIPGARNRPFKDNLASDGHFKDTETLRSEFQAILGDRPVDDVVHQCGSGVTACHNLLAMEAAGMSGSALYPGSWSEWSADPARPVATG